MLFNDLLILENFLLILTIFFILSTNILWLLFNSGFLLIFMGVLALINDMDIFIGFLWIIDLGVGLVFFIFILHFTPFLFQKSQIKLYYRYILFIFLIFITILIYIYFNPIISDNYQNKELLKNWIFKITYVDFYVILFLNEITELQTMKDAYFLLNNYEFFIVNFSLFFGLMTAILLIFLIHRIFNFLNYSEINYIESLNFLNNNFFIRNQNYIKQQNLFMATRVWTKQREKE